MELTDWCVARSPRLSTLWQLRKVLPESAPCPPRRVFTSHTPAFLESRRIELLEWIRKVGTCTCATGCRAVRVRVVLVFAPDHTRRFYVCGGRVFPLLQLATDEKVCQNSHFHDFLRNDANVRAREHAVVAPGACLTRPGLCTYRTCAQVFPTPRKQPAPAELGGRGSAGLESKRRDTPPLAPGTKRRIGVRDFTLLKVVGKGSFGKVMMVRKKDNRRIYAMKVLRKANIIKRNQVRGRGVLLGAVFLLWPRLSVHGFFQVAHTKTERNVLGKIDHPFIVGLNFAFQTKDKLYFVLDYCAGGELFFHLGNVIHVAAVAPRWSRLSCVSRFTITPCFVVVARRRAASPNAAPGTMQRRSRWRWSMSTHTTSFTGMQHRRCWHCDRQVGLVHVAFLIALCTWRGGVFVWLGLSRVAGI